MKSMILKRGFMIIVIMLLVVLHLNWSQAMAADKAYIVAFNASVDNKQKDAIIKSFDGIVTKDLDIINAKAVKLSEDKVGELTKTTGVIRVSVDGTVQLDPPMSQKIINQPDQFIPWGVEKIGVKSLGELVIRKVDVAVIDTGVDLEHPDLKENIANGINVVDPNAPPMDIDGHGTHVAGIIAGVNNNIGILGVAPKASIHPVSVFRKNGNSAPIAFYSDIISGLEWCLGNGIKIINISFGTYVDDPNLREAFSIAISAGAVIVASAGNNNSSKPYYPASYPGVISVSASDEKGNRLTWSNFGSEIDLSAPGVDIPSTYINNSYALLSGTDMAAPHVTGTMAVSLAAKFDKDKAIEILFDKATDAGVKGRDDYYGYGSLDAKKTIYSAWWQEPFTIEASAYPVTGKAPLGVMFSAKVLSGPPTKPVFYKWDFSSDKIFEYSNVISADTQYVYKKAGIYIAVAKLTDFLGRQASDFVMTAVIMPFSVDLTVDSPKGYYPLSTNFHTSVIGEAKVKTYDWDFDGDGTYEYSSGKAPDATHIYESNGVFTAMVKLTDIYGNYETDFVQVDVRPPFVVTLTATPNRGYIPLNINLSATATGGSSAPVLYEWDFEGDGTYDYSNNTSPGVTHTYTTAGKYNPTIRVTDDWGGTATGSANVAVRSPLKVTAEADPNKGYTPLSVNLSATVTGGSTLVLYEWDFEGDGTYDYSSQTSVDVMHAYITAGDYKATVKVTDDWGGTVTDKVDITVRQPLSVKIIANPVNGYAPLNVKLLATITGGSGVIAIYEWDFEGDGTYDYSSSISPDVVHIYNSVGNYKASVRVTDDWGGVANSVAAQITVTSDSTITLEAGLDTINIDIGMSDYLVYVINFQTWAADTFHVIVEQTVSPNDGGITWTSDYPSSGWVSNANITWLINERIYGTKVGTYEILTRATIVETGKQSEVKVSVNVLSGIELPELLPLGSEPDGVPISVSTKVTFTTTVVGPEMIPSQVILERVDAAGNFLAVLGQLVDDGTGDDLTAGDFVYSGAYNINESIEGIIYFKAEATSPGIGTFFSEIYSLPVTRFPTEIRPFDETKIVVDLITGAEILSNEVLVSFVEGTDPDTIEDIVNSIGGNIVGTIPWIGIYQIAIPDTGNANGVRVAINALLSHMEVESAEPNGIGVLAEVTPNDSRFSSQWGPKKIRADEAWVIARGTVTIGVLDTGIDYTHPDLSEKVIKGRNYVASLLEFWKWYDPKDDHGHGTHVAGIAAAKTNNSEGVAGISWESKILAIKVANKNGNYSEGNLASGIKYATNKGAKIINMSLEYLYLNNSVKKALDKADSKGVLLIAAAGNGASNVQAYPGAYPSVFCVGNTTPTDGRGLGSNYGSWVDIAAPGTDILSTMPTYDVTLTTTEGLSKNYDNLTGTSMASPCVSGAAAVVWSRHPSWSASEVRQQLEKSAVELPGLQLGYGRVDLFEAVFNGSFEISDLSEWLSIGSTSSITSLGPLTPTDRKRMGYASTGPSGDFVNASLTQNFKIQPGVTNLPLTFDYTFVTEEYPEWIGTIYNDALSITLITPSGNQQQLASETVNSSSFTSISGIDFPGGDNTIGWTGWKTIHVNVPVTEGSGTYKIYITDAGDDIYDSVILIDNIKFK
jgi:subtilisin family serine protease